jgi:hypothetical protein
MNFNRLKSVYDFGILEIGGKQLWAVLFGLGLALTVCYDERLFASTLACIVFFSLFKLRSSTLGKRWFLNLVLGPMGLLLMP